MIVAAAGRSLSRCCSNACRTFSAAKATPDQEVEGQSLFFPLLKQSKDVLRPAQLHVKMFLSQDPTSDIGSAAPWGGGKRLHLLWERTEDQQGTGTVPGTQWLQRLCGRFQVRLIRSLLVHGVKKPSLNFVNESLVELSYPPSCRGPGDSVPKLSEKIQYSQTDSIVEDIPALVEGVRKITGSPPRFYVTHSWGGVLLNSYFARFPDHVHECGNQEASDGSEP